MAKVCVEIITIGDEILIGQIVDTNSAWMAVELNKAGFEVVQITSVQDKAVHITQALDSALSRADVVLFTGGIGPTNDDITKQTLASYFGSNLVFDESVLRNIERLFSSRPHYVMNELTYKQAMVPDGCEVIQNLMGTAPVTWFERSGKIIVSMPGVPYEMKNVMSTEIIPRLGRYFHVPFILHYTLLVYGYGESALALKIADWEAQLPENLSLAYLPDYGIVRLRISAISEEKDVVCESVMHEVAKLRAILGEAIISEEDRSIADLISQKLIEKGLSLSVAESCTGGNIAHQITSISGCSVFFRGGIVAYSNDLKVEQLGVSAADIDACGAVSREVVEQMALGACRLFGSDVSVATSGIAGPGGGSPEKPVGTVWIAVSVAQKVVSREFHFGQIREQNVQRATQAALLLLKELL